MKKRKKKSSQAKISEKGLWYVLLFALYFFISVSLMYSFYQKFTFIELRSFQADIIAYIMLGKSIGTIIEIPHANLYIDITKECAGMKTYMFLASLFLATPFLSLKKRIFYALLSFPLAIGINIARITTTILISYATKPSFYSIYDNFIMSFIVSLLVLTIWYFLALNQDNNIK